MKKNVDTPVINIGLIGCGRISQTYVEAVAGCSACRLTAVADVRPQAAKSIAAHMHCKYFTDYPDVLDKIGVHAAIVGTPPDTHYEIINFFLDNHVHILCEKPFAADTNYAMAMAKKAQKNHCLLMVSSKYLYADDIIKTKSIVESGVLGDIIAFENNFCVKMDMRKRWNSERKIAGGGVLVDKGSNSADIGCVC